MPVSNPASTPRPDLIGAYSEYDPASDELIALKLMPAFSVPSINGRFGKIPIEAHTALVNTKRAPFTPASESRWESEVDTWDALEYTHSEPVDTVNSDIYKDFFDADMVATQRTRGVIERDYERDVAAAIFNPTTFPLSGSTGLSIVNEWDDQANATPLDDLNIGVEAMELRGVKPNTLVITPKTQRALSLTAQITGRIVYSGKNELRRSELTREYLAELFGLDQILVAGGIYNTAAPGQAFAGGRLWSDEYAFLCRVESGSDLARPQIGRTFEPEDMAGVKVLQHWVTEKIYNINTTAHRVGKLIDPNAGFLFGNVNT